MTTRTRTWLLGGFYQLLQIFFFPSFQQSDTHSLTAEVTPLSLKTHSSVFIVGLEQCVYRDVLTLLFGVNRIDKS